MIDWDPAQEVTPLMAFLAPAGPQFYFAGLRDGQNISYRAALGSNFSAPRDYFVAEPFDEAFTGAAVEDTEMAWRWRRRGFPMIFRAGALCWHHHHYTELEPFLARQETGGQGRPPGGKAPPCPLLAALPRAAALHRLAAAAPDARPAPADRRVGLRLPRRLFPRLPGRLGLRLEVGGQLAVGVVQLLHQPGGRGLARRVRGVAVGMVVAHQLLPRPL